MFQETSKRKNDNSLLKICVFRFCENLWVKRDDVSRMIPIVFVLTDTCIISQNVVETVTCEIINYIWCLTIKHVDPSIKPLGVE